MINIAFHSLWEAERKENDIIPTHSHNYYELVYYCFGKGETSITKQKFNFKNNNFAIIPPFTEHDEIHFKDAKVICLKFSCSPEFKDIFHFDNSNEIYRILKDILKETAEQNFGYKEIINIKLSELYYKIKRHESHFQSETKSFEYVINYLKENYHEKIKLTDCARQLNLSYDYFQHKFKEITSLSPQNFLTEQRLNASKEMLKKGFSCTETAYRCGFSTSAQFSMLFKKRFGVTPKKYCLNLSDD